MDETAAMSALLLSALVDDKRSGVAADAHVTGLARLSGGANMETWSFDLSSAGKSEALILRRLPGGGTPPEAGIAGVGELGLEDEAALITVAGAHAVAVPAVRCVLPPDSALGRGYIMSRERGEALPYRLLADPRYSAALGNLAYQCGEALGRIHQVPLEALPPTLPDHSGERIFARAQELLDSFGNTSPVLQLGLNWLTEHQRPLARKTLVHGDFRNGNLLVDEDGLVAVLDWELAHLGDPIQDLGYLTGNVWRFGSPLPVGGFGEYEDLLRGYHAVTGVKPALQDIYYWQVHTALSWGMVCLIMLTMYRSGQDVSLERAAVGRRLSEAEIDLLLLLDTQYA